MSDTRDVHRIEFAIDWSPGHAAVYLVDGPEPVLVDAGVPGDDGRRELAAGLDAAGFELGDVAQVVLTHPHSDHLGQVPALRDAGATVHAPAAVCEQLERDHDALAAGVRETAREAGLPDERVDEEVERALDSLRRNRRLLAPADVDDRLAYGDPVDVGGVAFEPVHTPGHQAYHAAYLATLGDGRVLFSGDALAGTFRAVAIDVGLDRGAYDAFARFETALDRLATTDATRVYPGHGPVFADVPGAVADARGDLGRAEAETARAVAHVDAATPLAVAEHRYGEIGAPGVLLDTIGALGALERDGRVSYERVDGVRRYHLDRRADHRHD